MFPPPARVGVEMISSAIVPVGLATSMVAGRFADEVVRVVPHDSDELHQFC